MLRGVTWPKLVAPSQGSYIVLPTLPHKSLHPRDTWWGACLRLRGRIRNGGGGGGGGCCLRIGVPSIEALRRGGIVTRRAGENYELTPSSAKTSHHALPLYLLAAWCREAFSHSEPPPSSLFCLAPPRDKRGNELAAGRKARVGGTPLPSQERGEASSPLSLARSHTSIAPPSIICSRGLV